MSAQNVQERTDVVTFKGKPMTLQGPALEAGAPAPEFRLTAGDLSSLTLDQLVDAGKRAAMLIVVPSLDTSVCSLESQKFNQRLGELPDERRQAEHRRHLQRTWLVPGGKDTGKRRVRR